MEKETTAKWLAEAGFHRLSEAAARAAKRFREQKLFPGSEAALMNKRPLSVTIIGCIFVVTGAIGLAYHITEFKTQHPFENRVLLILLVRLIAIFGGVFLLYGHDWARWLLLVWIAYHVILSAFHTMPELITHILLFVVIGYFLFRPPVSAYFRHVRVRRTNLKRKDDTSVL